MRVNAYAAPASGQPLAPTTIERRDVGSNDVLIEIQYAGICHSDIHTFNGDWGPQPFPVVPGHEIVGGLRQLVHSPHELTMQPPPTRSPTHVVVDAAYVLSVPDDIDLATAAPLLCAGITTYAPLRRCDAGAPGPARRLPSSASAGSATWPSRSPTHSGPRSPCSPSR